MRHEKPGITFLSVACFATPSKPAAGQSVIGNEHRDTVAPVEPEDLSRFEGEGGREAPEPATKLIDVPLENAIWRRPPWAAHPMNQEKMTL